MPNVSTADPAVIEALRLAAGGALLGTHTDADHRRTVLTLAAQPADLREALLAVADVAIARIDLREHTGVHPRMGAIDVLPVVALRHADAEAALALAPQLAADLGARGVPVRFYDAAHAEARRLPATRQAFESCAGPFDAGPDVPHASAGATALGVRGVLVAYNMTTEASLEVVRAAAADLREAASGLAGVRALGLALARSGLRQISCNLTRPLRCGIPDVWAAAGELLEARDALLRDEELVGFAPDAARGDRFPTGSLEAALHRAGLPHDVEEVF